MRRKQIIFKGTTKIKWLYFKVFVVVVAFFRRRKESDFIEYQSSIHSGKPAKRCRERTAMQYMAFFSVFVCEHSTVSTDVTRITHFHIFLSLVSHRIYPEFSFFLPHSLSRTHFSRKISKLTHKDSSNTVSYTSFLLV